MAWVKKLKLPLEIENNKIGIKFHLIPPGTFKMGSPYYEKTRYKNEAQHSVTLTQAFYCGKFEVTQEQWKRVMGDSPSYFSRAGDNAPVEQVSWDSCQRFLTKLCKLEGVQQGTYRLLTEAQWEYACRAGTSTSFCYGNSLSSRRANFKNIDQLKGSHQKTTLSVGSFKPNVFGLYDMHGNVEEWCDDWFNDCHENNSTLQTGTFKVYRGGSWKYGPGSCRSAKRGRIFPFIYSKYIGFRIMRVIPKRIKSVAE